MSHVCHSYHMIISSAMEYILVAFGASMSHFFFHIFKHVAKAKHRAKTQLEFELLRKEKLHFTEITKLLNFINGLYVMLLTH